MARWPTWRSPSVTKGPTISRRFARSTTRAFDQPLEGRIVDALRAHGAVQLSLVAEVEGRVVGHILFSPVTSAGRRRRASASGPMAVTPEQQRRGVGAALIDAGLARLRAAGCPFVVVLGHHEYYTRFGFVPASRYGMRCEWDVPDEVVHGARPRPGGDGGRRRADPLPPGVPDGDAGLSPLRPDETCR